ncbi:uncharacterized protein LOC121861276 isoform X2 [Homarus americanus]|nr:uncharacterized protein LOC121861276 isoform X2 [Homarus americanus]
MSKVRPIRCVQQPTGTETLVVLVPKRSRRSSSKKRTPPAASTNTASEDTMLKTGGNFSSDGGYGTMNPLFSPADEVGLPPDLPEPLRPTIPTSCSMPTIRALATTLTSLMAPHPPPPEVCYNVAAVDPLSPNLSPPPNTPMSPLSIPTSPSLSATRSGPKTPGSNPLSPSIITPPNTPSTPLSGLAGPQQEGADKYTLNYPQFPVATAVTASGPLYNILSPDLVDLTNLRPLPGEHLQTAPSDPRHAAEKNICTCSAVPNPYFVEHYGDAEAVIQDLVNLGNGVYDAGGRGRRDQPTKYPTIQELPGKARDWDTLGEKEDLVAACWHHQHTSTTPPENPTNTTPQRPDTETNKAHNNQTKKKPKDKNRRKTPDRSDCRLVLTDSEDDHKKHSRYRKLKIPMIDDDVDCRKPDSDVTTTTESDTSSSLSLDLLGPGASQLAEQLCDVTSEAGRLITREVQEGINYLTEPEDSLEFGWLDALTGIISIVTFYFDLVSDSLVAFYMYDDPAAQYWFLATLLLLVLPMVVANGFSLYWYWFDERSCQPQSCPRHPRVSTYVWVFRVAAHLLLQAPVLRQVDIVYYGTKSTAETVLREALVDEVMEAALVDPNQSQDLHDGGPDLQKDSTSHKDPTAYKDPPGASSRSSTRLSHSRDGANPSPASTNKRSVSACSVRTGGACARGGYVALWIHAERDAANVELLLALIQDAPLLILHLYIMSHTLPAQALQGHLSHTLMMQMVSVTMSLLALAWSVASFVRATRLTEPSLGNLSILDLFLLTLAHFCSIAPQVMSFSFFASSFVVAFFVAVTIHWVFMATWILLQLMCFPRTTCSRAFFTHDRQRGVCHWLDDVLYSAVMGLVFVFTFVDVGGVAAKIQGLFYHVLILLEELILLSVWLMWVEEVSWYHWLPLVMVLILFCLHLLFDALFTANAKPTHCLLLQSSPKAV